MNEYHLSKRLAQVAGCVPEGSRLADIGSDHAYLLVNLFLEGRITFGVAGEIALGPFYSAEKLIKKHQLAPNVEARFGDGLSVIDPKDQIDVITICGMGGSLIRSILEAGQDKLAAVETLVLEPNIDEGQVRRWLVQHDYRIKDEFMIAEHHQIYAIIAAEKGTSPILSGKEILMGPLLLTKKDPVFHVKWNQELEHRQNILTQLKKAKQPPLERIQQMEEEVCWIKEELE